MWLVATKLDHAELKIVGLSVDMYLLCLTSDFNSFFLFSKPISADKSQGFPYDCFLRLVF